MKRASPSSLSSLSSSLSSLSSSSPRLARTLALIAVVLALNVGCGGARDLSIGRRIDAGGTVPGDGGTTTGTGGTMIVGSGGSIPAGTGGTAGTGATGFGGSGTGGTAATDDPNAAGPRPLALLTRREYLNTVQDLFGLSIDANSLPADESVDTPFHTTGAVSDPIALQYRDAAETLAKSALTSVQTWLPCASTVTAGASADTEATCLTTFLGPTGLATRIYRRPLTTTASSGTDADVARLTQLYAIAREPPLSLDFTGAVGLVIEAMLQSADFLYHWQVDPVAAIREGTVVKLGNYEIANRLSYLLWGSMPDDALFAAAAAGQLGDLGNVETQVRRMLKDPKAAGTFADFFTDWLDIDTLPQRAKDAAVYPAYTDTLMAAMTGEVEDFVKAILVNGTGRLDDVLTGTSSFANQELAALYGVSGVTGSTLGPVSLNPAQRSGLLTTAGFLALTGNADGSNPPRRGNAILDKLLCQPVPSPPAVVPFPQPVTPGFTTRQRFEQHSLNPCAAACHTLIDPFGYAFENYDGIGGYRALDNGLPVNASTTVMLDGQPKTVPDARGLSAALAASDEVQTCFTRQWFRYGLGRPDTDQDRASINAAATKFKNSMRDIREMIVALATSRTFRYRAPGTGEVLP